MKKRSKVINVTIRSSSSSSVTSRKQKSTKQTISTATKSIKTIDIHQLDQCSSKSTAYDHHRQKKNNKKKKSCLRIILSVLLITLLIVTIVIIAVLLTLFIKQKPSISRIAMLRWNRTGITVAGITSSPGISSQQLNHTAGIALDWSNNLYVADRYNNRIQKFLRGSTNGSTIAGDPNGLSGTALNYFSEPTGVYVDENENLYVSDFNNNRVVRWTPASLAGTIIAGNGTNGRTNSTLNRPHGIQRAFYSDIFYIADFGNCRIMSYVLGNTVGTQVAGGSTCGNGITQLTSVWQFDLDLISNNLIIANAYANTIIRWFLGDNQWTLVAGINGVSNKTLTTFNLVGDVKLDPMGNMYAADLYNHRIQFFLTQQSSGTTIIGMTGLSGSNATLLNQPGWLILDTQLNIYVSDMANHRIQKYLRY